MDIDGILLVDKPAGITSHDVVYRIRRAFKVAKVGHGGTLDPNATGLLIILLGKGTKLSDQLMGSDKRYRGTLRLGRTTSSQDCDGEILEEKPFDHITQEQVIAEMHKLEGDIYQTPPMVSAIKINGVPLYKLARKGEEVERKPRLVHIYRYALTEWASPLVTFEVDCTKGTYVRTLAHDVGQTLGCGASLDALRRLKSGSYDVQQAKSLAELMTLSPDAFRTCVIDLRTLLTAG